MGDSAMGVHLERDRELGVVHGKKRARAELPRKRRQKEAEERDGRRYVQPVEAQRAGVEGGGHEPEEIHPTHEEEEPRGPRQLPDVALEIARQKEDERHGEMKEREEERHGAPAAREAVVEETDLLWQVSRPDDEELREREVRPEHRERQEEIPRDVHVPGLGEGDDWLPAP